MVASRAYNNNKNSHLETHSTTFSEGTEIGDFAVPFTVQWEHLDEQHPVPHSRRSLWLTTVRCNHNKSVNYSSATAKKPCVEKRHTH